MFNCFANFASLREISDFLPQRRKVRKEKFRNNSSLSIFEIASKKRIYEKFNSFIFNSFTLYFGFRAKSD